jgi:hypothetical protein
VYIIGKVGVNACLEPAFMVQTLQLCIVLAYLLFQRVFILVETHIASTTTVHEIKRKDEQWIRECDILAPG